MPHRRFPLCRVQPLLESLASPPTGAPDFNGIAQSLSAGRSANPFFGEDLCTAPPASITFFRQKDFPRAISR